MGVNIFKVGFHLQWSQSKDKNNFWKFVCRDKNTSILVLAVRLAFTHVFLLTLTPLLLNQALKDVRAQKFSRTDFFKTFTAGRK